MVLDRIGSGPLQAGRKGHDRSQAEKQEPKHCRRCATSGHCRFRQGFRHSARRLLCPCDDPDSIARGLCCDFQLGRGCFWPRVGGGARALGVFLVFCHFGTDGPGATEPGAVFPTSAQHTGPERIGLEKTTNACWRGCRPRAIGATKRVPMRWHEMQNGCKRRWKKRWTRADEAAAAGVELVIFGLFTFVLVKGIEGISANIAYEKLYSKWRADKRVCAGFQWTGAVIGAVFVAAVYSIALYGFTVAEPVAFVHTFPADKTHYQILAAAIDRVFDQTATDFGVFFNGIARSIRLTFRRAGGGLCPNALARGNGGHHPFCLAIGRAARGDFHRGRACLYRPSGILGKGHGNGVAAGSRVLSLRGHWHATGRLVRAERAGFMRLRGPFLDLMQTLPSFVYLIPIIAFFGTGKPPGILASMVFGLPPMIRLTALGLREVPKDAIEASRAFGATRWQTLTGVEMPLALPSIMTGINQTILMCLSLVVIAALIDAKGLGYDILAALQYAAKGTGYPGRFCHPLLC